MKTELTIMAAMAAACAAVQLTAMPTEKETRRAEPVVRKLLAPERAALSSGRKTRSEVAAAAMKLAGKADTEAEKLLLMKGAFTLYVQDGNLEKAAETMNALETAIPDLPPQSVRNMIESVLLGASKKGERARLYKLLDEVKVAGREETTTEKAKRDLARLFPGWTLDSEVPQENRKEWASGFCAHHRGQDSVLRLHPLNMKTPIVLSRALTLSKENPCLFLKTASFDKDSDFLLSVLVNGKEVLPKRLIRTPDSAPWQDITVPLYAWRGSKVKIEVVLTANDWWLEHPYFKRLEVAEGTGQEACGVVNDPLSQLFPGWALLEPDVTTPEIVSHRGQDRVLRMHPKDQKTPVVLKRTVKLSNKNPCLFLKVASFDGESDFVLSVRVNGKDVMPDRIVCTSDLEPWEDLVVPLFDWRGDSVEIEIVTRANGWWCEWSHFARIEIAEGNGQETCGVAGVRNGTETAEGYTWSYFVKNGEATVTAAVSPSPKGAITIPATLDGVKVTGLGKKLFYQCEEVTSVTIPEGVTSIGPSAFDLCYGLKSVTIPSSVKTIGDWAFSACFRLQTVAMPESLEYIGKGAFINCRSFNVVNLPAKLAVISDVAFGYCGRLGSVTIPASVTKIGGGAFGDCGELTEVTMLGERPETPKDIFNKNCGKLKSIHVPANAKSWVGMKEWQGIPLVFDAK